MIKRVPTFVSGVQKSVLLDFISQNKVKTCQNYLHQKFPHKNEQIYIFWNFCGAIKILCAVLFDFKLLK